MCLCFMQRIYNIVWNGGSFTLGCNTFLSACSYSTHFDCRALVNVFGLTHWGRVTPYCVGKFNIVSDSKFGFLMSRASFQVPTCQCFDRGLLKWLVKQTAAASSAAAVCITRRNRWPRFPKFTRPQRVKTGSHYSGFSNSTIRILPIGKFYESRVLVGIEKK